MSGPVATKRVALITGGTRGIGLGIARCLAAEGFALALNGVRGRRAVAPVIAQLEALGAPVHYVNADIGLADERAELLAAVRERFGRLDVLVNNAGVAPQVRADILEAGEESFDRLMRTNLKGPYFLTQAVARWMVQQATSDPDRDRTRRCIVFITSVSAEAASTDRGDYCMTKAALSMAAKLWAARLAELDITVYEVRPGIIHTDMTSGVATKYDALIEGGLLPQRRWGEPQDVGRAVAALVRGDLGYSTGAVIPVDGGFGVRRL